MIWTLAFYGLVSIIQMLIVWFVLSYWHKATRIDWRHTDEDSRDAYVGIAKTMITAAGIAVALLASITLSSDHRPSDPLVAFSAKLAAVLLILCLCLLVVVMLSLTRGHEQAEAREVDKIRQTGHQGRIEMHEGSLTNFELRVTLLSAGAALSCFFTGFLFLARIVWHF